MRSTTKSVRSTAVCDRGDSSGMFVRSGIISARTSLQMCLAVVSRYIRGLAGVRGFEVLRSITASTLT